MTDDPILKGIVGRSVGTAWEKNLCSRTAPVYPSIPGAKLLLITLTLAVFHHLAPRQEDLGDHTQSYDHPPKRSQRVRHRYCWEQSSVQTELSQGETIPDGLNQKKGGWAMMPLLLVVD